MPSRVRIVSNAAAYVNVRNPATGRQRSIPCGALLDGQDDRADVLREIIEAVLAEARAAKPPGRPHKMPPPCICQTLRGLPVGYPAPVYALPAPVAPVVAAPAAAGACPSPRAAYDRYCEAVRAEAKAGALNHKTAENQRYMVGKMLDGLGETWAGWQRYWTWSRALTNPDGTPYGSTNNLDSAARRFRLWARSEGMDVPDFMPPEGKRLEGAEMSNYIEEVKQTLQKIEGREAKRAYLREREEGLDPRDREQFVRAFRFGVPR
jgi:hypothetical protein